MGTVQRGGSQKVKAFSVALEDTLLRWSEAHLERRFGSLWLREKLESEFFRNPYKTNFYCLQYFSSNSPKNGLNIPPISDSNFFSWCQPIDSSRELSIRQSRGRGAPDGGEGSGCK